ncbi:MAG: pirin family protein [Kofleriaceae bacterium]
MTPTRREALRVGALGLVALCSCQAGRRRHQADVRRVLQRVDARASVDGAGVHLRRSLGGAALAMVDPFLLLDEIRTDTAADLGAGFPDHPHRGFETVSYVLEGAFAHADSVGNHGRIADGGAQWMTAGRGIIHREIPTPSARGSLWGLQIWVNLPAHRKWTAPRYQDLEPSRITRAQLGDADVRVVAGTVAGHRGPIDGIVTAPTLLDLALPAGGRAEHALPGDHAAVIYGLAGQVAIGSAATTVAAGQLAVLGPGARVTIGSTTGGRVLLLAAAPIREPVARRGPFVMTTDDELRQAFADYRARRLRTAESLGASPHTSARRRRRALAMTDTELKLMAAAASIGLSRSPTIG